MSGAALGWAKAQNAPSVVAKAVLVCLADYADPQGYAWPSVPTLAAEVQVSDRTIQRAIRALVESGLLEVDERTRKDGGQTSNSYRVPHLNITSVSPPPVTECHPPGDTGVTPPVTLVSPPYEPPLEPNLSDERFTPADAMAEWNEVATACGLPVAKTLSDARAKSIRARIREQGRDGWRAALRAVRSSAFLQGENDRQWRADLDFVCQPLSFGRLIEGFYGKPADEPAPVAEPDPWPNRLSIWNRDRHWRESWGPPPGKPGYRGPEPQPQAA